MGTSETNFGGANTIASSWAHTRIKLRHRKFCFVATYGNAARRMRRRCVRRKFQKCARKPRCRDQKGRRMRFSGDAAPPPTEISLARRTCTFSSCRRSGLLSLPPRTLRGVASGGRAWGEMRGSSCARGRARAACVLQSASPGCVEGNRRGAGSRARARAAITPARCRRAPLRAACRAGQLTAARAGVILHAL